MKLKNLLPSLLLGGLIAISLTACETERENEHEGKEGKMSDAQLKAAAKLSEADARQVVMAKLPNATIKEAELEKEHGKIIWSFDITVPDKSITEVNVNAVTGELVGMEKEDAKAEAKEKAEDEKKEKSEKSDKKLTDAQLKAAAKLSEADARQVVMAKLPNATIKEAELEAEGGKIIWSFDISVPDKSVTEVNVNAVTGELVGMEKEDAKAEAKEKAEDEKNEKK
jgi:uncharacterized membrane protein YkoI